MSQANSGPLGDEYWREGEPLPQLSLMGKSLLYKAYIDIKLGRWQEPAPDFAEVYEQNRSLVNEAFVRGFPRQDYKITDMQELWGYILRNGFYQSDVEIQQYIAKRELRERHEAARKAWARFLGIHLSQPSETY